MKGQLQHTKLLIPFSPFSTEIRSILL